MKLQDALNILNLQGDNITLKDCERAYRKACMKYHPDRNPGGLEMMKAVNAAWETLSKWEWKDNNPVNVKPSNNANYGDALNAAINAVIDLDGIKMELCGAWIWISGNTYPHKKAIKAAGYMWASAKKQWYFRPPEWASANKQEWTMEQIRETFGSEEIVPERKPPVLKIVA